MSPVLPAQSKEQDITDEQIDQLLLRAEERLRDPASALERLDKDFSVLRQTRKLNTSGLPAPYVVLNGEVAIADPRRLVEESTRTMANGIRRVEDPLVTKRRKLETKAATAGSSWFNLPRTNLTPELKRDLDLLRMRSVLDPKRFYKKENTKSKPPEFSQVGIVIEGPTDYFNGRIPKKQRKRTLAEEVLEAEREDGRFARQYEEVQKKKTSGKKGDYQKRMQKRYGRNYKK